MSDIPRRMPPCRLQGCTCSGELVASIPTWRAVHAVLDVRQIDAAYVGVVPSLPRSGLAILGAAVLREMEKLHTVKSKKADKAQERRR